MPCQPRLREAVCAVQRAVYLGGGRGLSLGWCVLPALLPWTPVFETARLVLLFMRAARVDTLEQRFRVEATAFMESFVESPLSFKKTLICYLF